MQIKKPDFNLVKKPIKLELDQNSMKDNHIIKISNDEYMDKGVHTNEFRKGLGQMSSLKTIERTS